MPTLAGSPSVLREMTRETAMGLLAVWLASWAAEERALDAAARAHDLPAVEIRAHLDTIRREREQLHPFLLARDRKETVTATASGRRCAAFDYVAT